MKLTHKKSLLCLSLMGVLSAPVTADIAVITHKNSMLDHLQRKELRQLFLGRITRLSEGTMVSVIDNQSQKAMHIIFSKTILDKSEQQLITYWARQKFAGRHKRPKIIEADDARIIAAVIEQTNTISYIDAANVSDDVKVLMTIEE